MRDPARIEIMIAALREAWLSQPDTRLGQLFSNVTSDVNSYNLKNSSHWRRTMDQFYIEDDEMLAGLKRSVHVPVPCVATSHCRNSCPDVDLTLDTISGCDYYCVSCGARHGDPCNKGKMK